jgi:transcriptional regulator with XRE-family HTH domain
MDLTQAQVAEKIGTSQSAVARMESGSGKHSPSLATLTKYADALGCKLEVRLARRIRSAKNLTARPSALRLDSNLTLQKSGPQRVKR